MFSVVPALFTGVGCAVLCFFVLGLTVEHFSEPLSKVMFGGHALPALTISMLAFAGAVVAILRWTRQRTLVADAGRKFALAAAASLGGSVGLTAVFLVLLNTLPRAWFSRGGDWDLVPALEGAIVFLIGGLAGFWAVFRRAWLKSSAGANA